MSLSVAELNRMAEDTGCELHDDCLTCPFSECVYDTKHGAQHFRTLQKQATIEQMAKYHSTKEIAEQLGVSRRTVERALKGAANG